MEIEKAIEFILDQLAKQQAQFGDLQGLVARIAEQQLELVGTVGTFQREIGGAVLALAEHQKLMAEEQRRLAEEQRRLAEEQRRLAEAQRHTDQNLNALITIVDELIRKPRQ